MFIQVIQGKASDPEGLKAQLDRWSEELAPGAEGFLGSTAGVAEDGTFVALARFESEEAARANSDRSEQGTWWEETAKHLEGEASFRDCSDVDTFLEGGDDLAGFVQVIQGRVTDPERMRSLREEAVPQLEEERPEVLGGYVAWDGDFMTQVVYFASEHTAREGEGKVLPEELQEKLNEMRHLIEEPTYLNLTEPWIYSPEEDEEEGG